MRLLYYTSDGQLRWTKDLIGDDLVPDYAILSHTWVEDQEVTFDDMIKESGTSKTGYNKIQFCAQQAKRDGLHHFWIDTCCIDKSNNSELSEAIISMFRWYKNAKRCYVYLSDVSSRAAENNGDGHGRKLAIRKSRWFTRGWTLQELIAPASVEFFSKEGDRLGDKRSLVWTLHEITGIAVQALEGSPMDSFTVDERMSWAQKRNTKREEDAAYSLLGIFDVQIPLLYGEGRQKALDRLRKAIGEQYSINLPIATGASYNSYAEEHNSTCLPNTRTDLLRYIHDWVNDKNGTPIFWLNGAAGIGKSTIARTVARSFADQQQLGASFFFKRGEGECGNASRFFTTIATQLARCVSGLGPRIKKAIDADPAICEKTLRYQFEKLILHPLLDVAEPPALVLLVVIDALDECEHDHDIRVILQLLLRTRDLKSLLLRVFVTSRPELHIRLGFKQLPDFTFEDLILHEVAKQTIQHDIRVYFEHELARVREERSLSPGWPRRDQVEALVEQADSLFIFAATACRYIGDRRDNPEKRLELILENQKAKVSKLDATYLPILNQLYGEEDEEDRERWACEFQDIVGSIVVLETPLSTASLAGLLHISKDDVSCRLDSLHSVLSIPDRDDMPVRLLNLSFREFLVDASKKEKSPFWVDERARHESLASHCLQLMSSPNGLRQNMCNLQPGTLRGEVDQGRITSNLSPELQYACRYWVYHLKQSQLLVDDKATVDTFLQKHFLHWLEAMSLIRETNKCVSLLETLSLLVMASSSALSAFLYDAQQFTIRFRYLLENAPLQIYSSALIFAPEASIVRKAFVDEMPAWIKLLSKREDGWDACRTVLEGHTATVSAVAFSPDGQLVASASHDNTVRVWEAATGSCCSVLEGHTSYVDAVAFSPDGQLVASASDDKTVQVWEATTGLCRSALEGHTATVSAVAFSPDGQLVASASHDKTVRVWDAATGSCRSALEGHISYVNAVAFSPDGQLVASASDDATVRLWDVTTGRVAAHLEGHSGKVMSATFSPNTKLVASASNNGTVLLWDVHTGVLVKALKTYQTIQRLSFSFDSLSLEIDEHVLNLRFLSDGPAELLPSRGPTIRDGWITLATQRVIWLPSDYRNTCTAFHNGLYVVALVSGTIVMLQLDVESLVIHPSAACVDDDCPNFSGSATGTLLEQTRTLTYTYGESTAVEQIGVHLETADDIDPGMTRVKPSEVDELQSVFSDTEDIQSSTSSHRTSHKAVAERQIALFIANNQCLLPMLDAAIGAMTKARFVQNFRRLLKLYYLDIRSNAHSDLEQETVRLLRSREARWRIAQMVVEFRNPTQGNRGLPLDEQNRLAYRKEREYLEKWVTAQQMGLASEEHSHDTPQWIHEEHGRSYGVQPALRDSDNQENENDGIHSENHSQSDDEYEDKASHEYPNVQDIEKFLGEDIAFRNLSTNLGVFVLPDHLRSLATLSWRNNVRLSTEHDLALWGKATAVMEWLAYTCWICQRPGPRMSLLGSDRTRIYWQCSYGNHHYAETSASQAEIIKQLSSDQPTLPPCIHADCMVARTPGILSPLIDVVISSIPFLRGIKVHLYIPSKTPPSYPLAANFPTSSGSAIPQPFVAQHKPVEFRRQTQDLESITTLNTESNGVSRVCAMKLQSGTASVLRLWKSALICLGLTEPAYSHGKTRIRWQCKCGVRGLGDVAELAPGGTATLKTHMKRSTRAKFVSASNLWENFHPKRLMRITGTYLQRLLGIGSTRRSQAPTLPQHDPRTILETLSIQAPATQPKSLHVMACMHKTRYGKNLCQEQIDTINTDRELFVFLNGQFRKHRGNLLSVLSLRAVQGIYFVKFRLSMGGSVEIRYHEPCCSGRPCECLPPQDMVEPSPIAQYRCKPGPPATYPPILPDYLLHLFISPSCIEENETWILDQLPKRTCGQLHGAPHGPAEGWGIFYEEGWDIVRIAWLYLSLGVLGSLLFGVLWSIYRGDVQGAFGISAWWVTAGGSLLAILAIRSAKQ